MKVSADNGNLYNSLEENQFKGNLIILNDEEDDVNDKAKAASEMTVDNELQPRRPESCIKVNINSLKAPLALRPV